MSSEVWPTKIQKILLPPQIRWTSKRTAWPQSKPPKLTIWLFQFTKTNSTSFYPLDLKSYLQNKLNLTVTITVWQRLVTNRNKKRNHFELSIAWAPFLGLLRTVQVPKNIRTLLCKGRSFGGKNEIYNDILHLKWFDKRMINCFYRFCNTEAWPFHKRTICAISFSNRTDWDAAGWSNWSSDWRSPCVCRDWACCSLRSCAAVVRSSREDSAADGGGSQNCLPIALRSASHWSCLNWFDGCVPVAVAVGLAAGRFDCWRTSARSNDDLVRRPDRRPPCG